VKKLVWIVALALLLSALIAACSGGSDAEPTTRPTEENPTEAPTSTVEAPTVEAPTVEAPTAYPAPPTPTPPGIDSGYPAFVPQPTINPYPGGLVTILHPMGIQCEEPEFPDISAAIGALEEAGIVVLAAEEIALNVCESCSCATSEHFRVQINVDDLDKAIELGWSR
jgi:hypothetical protein